MSFWFELTGTVVWILVVLFLLGRIWRAIRHSQQHALTNRWVVVTGCDSGIGRGVMEQLIAAEANVVAFCYTAAGTKAALAADAKAAPQLDITLAQNSSSIERIAQSPNHAINDIIHTLSAVRPKSRYLSGTAAKTFSTRCGQCPNAGHIRLKKDS